MNSCHLPDCAVALAAAKSILAGILCLPEAHITAEQRLLDDLAMDSLELIELAMELEDRWSLRLDSDQLPGIATVRDVALLLMRAS